MSISSIRWSSVAMMLCASAGHSGGQPCPAPVINMTAPRGGNSTVLQIPDNYEYVPSVMHDGSYRMWFCTGRYEGPAWSRTYRGDQIAYATAPTPSGPWSSPVAVFSNSGRAGSFDEFHTCDPSVIRVMGTYYMYYGGHNNRSYPDAGYDATSIGVATSTDGVSWSRLNGGQPIIRAARGAHHPDYPALAATRGYGAGQPSVTWVDGLFYLAYTDTTGHGGNQVNGAGIYVLRSPDPTFQTAVEALVAPGAFAPRTAANQTRFSLIEAFSIDWQYVDMLQAFALADVIAPAGHKAIRVTLWNKSLGTRLDARSINADWNEGPALVSRPDKHAVPAATICGVVPFDILRSVGPGGAFEAWGLAHVGMNLSTGLGCACARLPQVFEGTAVVAAGYPWAVVVDGRRLHFQLAAPALRLAKSVYGVTPEIYAHIPAGPSMFAGGPVYHSDGTPGAFLLNDGRLWPASCYDLVVANQSGMSYMPPWHWMLYPIGPPLFCVR